MKRIAMIFSAAMLAAAPAVAQDSFQPLKGTRLDIAATGEVTRVPDLAIISAGVVTRAATAKSAIQQNAIQMERVRSALKRAGVADRDIQTSSISLNPDYVYAERQPPRLTGYQASNMVSVRFRDIATTGSILDALVAEGANQISGPTLTIDQPEKALDEARARAVASGRERAELYARTLGMRVVRILSVSETGGPAVRPMAMMAESRAMDAAQSKIEPGEQRLQVALSISFELR